VAEAALEFAAQAYALDKAGSLIGWQSPEEAPNSDAKLWPFLTEARGHDGAGVSQVEAAL